jgi:predicted phage baseplate assembly protein
MTMPLAAPELDDRRFADLVAEIRTLIPRYAPEWTDHNDSDPGMAIAKLFAWSTELTLWRLNQVPERAYIKFLQMVGVERRPASASRTEISFAPARTDVPEIFVPQGTQVAAPADAEGPIIFETIRPLAVLGATLAAVQSFDGFGYSVDTTKAQTGGQWFYPFGANTRDGAALMLGFASQVSLTSGTIDLAVRIAKDKKAPAPLACEGPTEGLAAIPAPANLSWEYWDLVRWQPLVLLRDETQCLLKDGHITLRGPGAACRLAKLGDVTAPLYWLRCRLEAPNYERAPRLDAVIINTVPAMQAATNRDEIVGASNGRPDQSFGLAGRPVLPAVEEEWVDGAYGRRVQITSLTLEIDEGQGFAAWQEVDDFYASGPSDPHYVLNRNLGAIQFGDGVHGRIPLAYEPPGLSGNIVARHYLIGGGRRGMLAAATVTEIQTFLPGIESATNPFPAEGGSQEESVAATKLRAAAEIKSNCRAVTCEDFEVRALEAGVMRAKALPLTHPRYPGAKIPGAVTVIVVPDGDVANPMPNSTTLATVCAHLDKYRLMTTEVHVRAPVYRLIRVGADVLAARNADFADVRRTLETRLSGFLHPLTGGPDGLGWPFGGTVFFSDIYRLILETQGVLRIADGQLTMSIDGDAAPFCRDIPLCPGELVYAEGHDLNILAAQDGGR